MDWDSASTRTLSSYRGEKGLFRKRRDPAAFVSKGGPPLLSSFANQFGLEMVTTREGGKIRFRGGGGVKTKTTGSGDLKNNLKSGSRRSARNSCRVEISA